MLKFLLIITLAIKSQAVASNKIINNLFNISEIEQQFHEAFLNQLYQKTAYEGVVILNENGKHQYCDNFLEYLKFKELPTIVITGNVTCPYRKYFNNQILSIVCMTTYQYNVLEQLAQIFNNMRYTRIVIIMDQFSNDLDAHELRDFLHYSNKLKMLNVLVIFKDFFKTHQYVQYTIFPEFEMEFGLYDPSTSNPNMLPDRLRDLKGYKLRTVIDNYEPRAMVYCNEHNETVLVGYIARLVQTMSESLNASLHFPLREHGFMTYRDIVKYANNNTVDIPACSTSILPTDDFRDFSYPFEIGKWCVMLPMENAMTFKELFFEVLHSQIMFIILFLVAIFTIALYLVMCKKYCHQWRFRWPEIILNDMAIRGVLGQGFNFSACRKISQKLIYTMLLLSGLTISTVFVCYLQTFCTQPPLEPKINNYQDLAKSSVKVAMVRQELKYFLEAINGSLTNINFYMVTEYADYFKLRDSFDRRFAYPTATSKMFYYDSLQDYFNKKLFRYSTEMCPRTMLQFVFPIGPNSYFKQRLDNFILNTLQSGLLDYWISMSYRDVVATGKLIHVNITNPIRERPLNLDDLYWIWIYYLISIAVACVVFILELLINKMFRNCQ